MSFKRIKNMIGIVMVAFMLFMPVNVQAEEVTGKEIISENQQFVNRNLPKEARLDYVKSVQAPTLSASNEVLYSLTDLKSKIQYSMNNRETSFSVTYKGDTSNLKSDLNDIISDILSEDDYLNYSYTGYQWGYSGYTDNVTISFSFKYLTTKTQENFVNSQVDSILGQVTNSSMSDDEKEKAIHDYIVANVQYDTSLTRYSAYNALSEGKTVCQGYALLAFKMLKNAGIQNNIVEGTADNGYKSESHAWNLVDLNGKWYHLDCTWDDPVPDTQGRVLYNYYNITDAKIALDHTWNHSNYPSATTTYLEKSEQNPVTGVNLSTENLALKVGKTYSLEATIKPTAADNKNLSWTSTDSSIITVDNNGNIMALKEGNAIITVKTEDGGYTDSCEIDVVSKDSVSSDFSNYKKWSSSSTVSKDKIWNIKFTKAFDTSTINSNNILMLKEYDNGLYAMKDIEITYNNANDTISIKPTKRYTLGDTYQLIVTQSILSKDGKAIPKAIVLTFSIVN